MAAIEGVPIGQYNPKERAEPIRRSAAVCVSTSRSNLASQPLV